MIVSDFNMIPLNPNVRDLISDYELQNLLSRPTRFKNANPSCIDNFLTTRKFYFIKILLLEASTSDSPKSIETMLKSAFTKGKPKTILHRCNKNFDN